jgi:hypothetical protein
MRRKKAISPEKPQQDSIEYRFRLLFWPYLSYALAVTILVGFAFGIFAAINTKSITEAIVALIGYPSFLLMIQTLGAWFVVRESDIIMNSDNISAVDYWYRRKCIGWQEINLIKQSQLFGMRYLSIKTTDGRSVQIASHFYNSSELLDRVRELAGEDHILVRALEKELSRPRYELTKVWCWVIGSIALTMSIYLIGGNMYAAEQEKPLEQAIASYVRQHPKTAPNQSAIDLQSLMTKLGLSVEVFGDGSKAKVKPSPTIIAEWKTTRSNLEKYLDKQLAKTEDSIYPLPTQLSNYLRHHQASIVAIETHLIDNPLPQWGVDLDWIQQSNLNTENNSVSPLLRYLDILNTEKLLIVNILDKQQLPNADLSRDLAAIEKIQQSIQSQPSFIGQLVSRIGEGKISKLVRQVDTVPNGWGTNLFRIDRHQQMLDTISGESMMTGRIMQDSSLFNLLLISQENPLRFIPGFYHLARPQLRLATVDRYAETQQGLAYWRKQNICRTDGKNGVVDSPPVFGLIDDLLYSPTQMTSQYKKVLKQDLYWELTNSVRQVKAKLVAGEKVDRVAKEFNLPSQVCPGENWTAKAKDGAVSIEFSHPPDWKALGVHPNNIDPLTYKIKPVDRPNL